MMKEECWLMTCQGERNAKCRVRICQGERDAAVLA